MGEGGSSGREGRERKETLEGEQVWVQGRGKGVGCLRRIEGGERGKGERGE